MHYAQLVITLDSIPGTQAIAQLSYRMKLFFAAFTFLCKF